MKCRELVMCLGVKLIRDGVVMANLHWHLDCSVEAPCVHSGVIPERP